MNIVSDYFLINQKNQEKDEEDLKILNSINYHKKSNSKFQIERYEKFKPKPKIEKEKIDTTILTAENKVKLLLASFFHDFKAEQIKEKYNKHIITKIKRKNTKILNKKISIHSQNTPLNVDIAALKMEKNNTINDNKFYINRNKNKSNQSPSTFRKKENSTNLKSLFINSCHTLKENLSDLKKIYQKKFDLGFNNILMDDNFEKSREINRKKSIDFHFHRNGINSIGDIEKYYIKDKANPAKNIKKYKKAKTKFKNNSKNSFNSVLSNSLHKKFDLNSIINEKLLKLTGDIREGMAIEEMLKESKNKHSAESNNNFKYCYSYLNNNTKNTNMNYCFNFSIKAKSETGSPKKYFNVNDINKIEKTENINDIRPKSSTFNLKENYSERNQKPKSHFSKKIFPVNTIARKKNIQINNTLKSLKEEIRNTIILRPEDLNLTNVSDLYNSQNKTISGDKEKSYRSKMNISIDNKINKSNLTDSNKNINKKFNKNKFDNEDETVNNEIIENSINFSNNQNENRNQDKNSFCSFRKTKTKKEIIKENFRVLTYKKLVYDSLDDEEVEEEYNNKYIHPDFLFIKIFDNLVCFFALCIFIYTPYYLASTKSFCKNYKKSDYIIAVFVEIAYLLDFILGFFKAYYNFEEQLIINNIAIIKRYFESWFWLDLISALPLYSYLKMKESSCSINNGAQPYGELLHNLHYLIILNKLLKVFKINFINHNFLQLFNKLGVNSTVLIQFLILFSGLHLSSCLHIFIGRNSFPNWIIESKLENSKFLDLYITSIYSIVTSITTVGYGDIVCHSFNERIFQIFLLVLGSLAYSWLVSSFSNYIQKLNEKFVDFENRRQILNEIKYNYPQMSNYLYERSLRYLKYKNCNEKRDKNMIFDCLPISLKNNLVYEMYKPIIKSFIFFKNFDNTDFIVRVILAFRPILAFKNDILLNEGDMVDDILFVKKGILSVQIPINIKNPEEYIDKYLYGDILEQKDQQRNFLNSGNQNIFEQNNNGFMDSVIFQQEYNKMNFLNFTEKEDLINRIKKKEEEIERKKNTRYIKIVSIRENEHFGDVLMFLDQRSPLRVKVTSKRAELFFLKKMDVIKMVVIQIYGEE